MPKTTTIKEEEKKVVKEKETAEQKKIRELEEMIKSLMAQKTEVVAEKTEPINPNKRIKIASLTYGKLSLYCPARGFIRFDKYGETKSMTYSTLVEYVNNCRKAAEDGLFYIYDKAVVEELGLEEAYEHILEVETIDKLLLSSEADIEIFANVTEAQKKNIVDIICDKVYNDIMKDYNKINRLSDILGIDIMAKISIMKGLTDFVQK